MTNAQILAVGPNEIPLIVQLHNEVFNPPQDSEYFMRRFQARHNVSMMVAMLDEDHVGCIIGFEIMPTTFFSWLCGVKPECRRLGIATQLIQAQQEWAKEKEYAILRFECQNQHRPMLHVAISEGFDLVGMRWDTFTANNVAVFEKDLR